MIAVWLVGPPRLVARAMTLVGSSPAVSAGARSSATSTDGTSRRRDARLGQTLQLGYDAAAEVAQVGDALGHQPAELLEHRGELVDRRRRGRLCRRAARDGLLDRLAQSLVRDQSDLCGEHLGGDSARLERAALQPLGDGLDRRGEPVALVLGRAGDDRGQPTHVDGRRRPDHRPDRDAGHDRRAFADVGRGVCGGGCAGCHQVYLVREPGAMSFGAGSM